MMNLATNRLLEQALALPPHERATLVDKLLTSLDQPDPEILKMWSKEAEHRIAAFNAGKMESHSEEDVFLELGG